MLVTLTLTGDNHEKRLLGLLGGSWSVTDFLEIRKYKVKELKYHYHVTGKVTWMAMSAEIKEMKNVKFLYTHVVGESGYDRASRTLKLD